MAEDQQPKLDVRQQSGVRIIELRDRKILDELVITRLGEQLSELVDSQPAPKLVLDFQQVEHLSSAALGVLITLNKQVTERQGKLALANIQPQIFEVFKITRLNKLFNIQNTTQAAVEAVA
jgi:anti-sigma B factor antagonist